MEIGPVEDELYLKHFYCCKIDGSSQPHHHSSKAICCKLGRFQCRLTALPCTSSRAVPTSLHPRKATRLDLGACQAQLTNSPNKLIAGNTTAGQCCRGCARRPDCTSGTGSDSLPRQGCGCDASWASPVHYGFLCSSSCSHCAARPVPTFPLKGRARLHAASLGGSTRVFSPSLFVLPDILTAPAAAAGTEPPAPKQERDL